MPCFTVRSAETDRQSHLTRSTIPCSACTWDFKEGRTDGRPVREQITGHSPLELRKLRRNARSSGVQHDKLAEENGRETGTVYLFPWKIWKSYRKVWLSPIGNDESYILSFVRTVDRYLLNECHAVLVYEGGESGGGSIISLSSWLVYTSACNGTAELRLGGRTSSIVFTQRLSRTSTNVFRQYYIQCLTINPFVRTAKCNHCAFWFILAPNSFVLSNVHLNERVELNVIPGRSSHCCGFCPLNGKFSHSLSDCWSMLVTHVSCVHSMD